jgi:hypothetical protein
MNANRLCGASVLNRKFGGTEADAGSCLPVHGIREHAGGT